jgi:uncharacterized membrane protein
MSDEPEKKAAHEQPLVHMELLVSNLLRGGVLVSLAFVVVGTIVTFVNHPEYARSSEELQRLTQPGAAVYTSIGQTASGMLAVHGQAIVAAGLLILIATPVIRVGVSAVAFLWEGDKTYAAICFVVLFLLLVSFFLGRVE